MPTQVSENPEVAQHYATQVALTAALLAALRRLWPSINPTLSKQAEARYRDGVAAVVDQFASASISLSADYYEAMRAQAGITAPLNLKIVDSPPRSLIDAGIDWAMRAEAEMADIEAKTQQRVEAAMQKAVADAGRSQVMGAIAGDEKALGFARVAHVGACAWCISLAIRKTKGTATTSERPGVYKSRDSAGQLPPNTTGQINRYHDNCHCTVVPIFSPDYTLEPHLAELENLYFEATQNSKTGERLNDFRRALEAMRAGRPISTPGTHHQPGNWSPSTQVEQLKKLIDGLGE